VVLAAQPDRYRYLDEDRVDRLVLRTDEPGVVLDGCRRLAEQGGLVGVTSSSEYFVATAAEVAGKLGLPAPDPLALVRCRHKDRQRAALAGAGLAIPAWRAVGEVGDAVAAADDIGYPVVVKPTTGSGSVGVRLCPDAAAVHDHVAALLDAPVNERGHAVPRLVLVERYVPGAEFSVETFDDVVVGVVAKHLGPAPFFVETGHDLPAPVPGTQANALGETARHALAALGLGWGAAHTELRLTRHGPTVIEVNPRLAGGMIPCLIRLATGIDIVDALVARASGQLPVPVPQRLAHASIRFVLADTPGTVASVAGLDEARRGPGVELVEATVAVGADIAITHSFRDRLGYAVAIGEDAQTAADRADRAAAGMHITTR
jgi:biotin carboxylase